MAFEASTQQLSNFGDGVQACTVQQLDAKDAAK
jgi:hypothetical protein